MAIVRHIYLHHLYGMISINSRSNLQTDNPRFYQFDFSGFNAVVYIRDGYSVSNGLKLHSHLELTTVLGGEQEYEADSIMTSILVQITSVLGFSAVASCGESQLISHIIVHDDHQSEATFVTPLLSRDGVIIGTPRAIDEQIFYSVWDNWLNNEHKDRIFCAFSWFVKGLNEEPFVDKFISFFISIEMVSSILKKKLKLTIKNPGKWDGVKQAFSQLHDRPDFAKIKEARNQLLHESEEITPAFSAKIKGFIDPIRNGALLCIGKALELPDDIITKQMRLSPRRSIHRFTTELSGSLENLPVDLNVLLNDLPFITCTSKLSNYRIENDGRLNIDIETKQTPHLPNQMKFTMKSGGLVAHAEAGIERVEYKANL